MITNRLMTPKFEYIFYIDSGLCVCDPIMRLFGGMLKVFSCTLSSLQAKIRKFAEGWTEKQNNRTRANKRRKRSHNEIWQYHLESMLFGSSTDNTLI